MAWRGAVWRGVEKRGVGWRGAAVAPRGVPSVDRWNGKHGPPSRRLSGFAVGRTKRLVESGHARLNLEHTTAWSPVLNMLSLAPMLWGYTSICCPHQTDLDRLSWCAEPRERIVACHALGAACIAGAACILACMRACVRCMRCVNCVQCATRGPHALRLRLSCPSPRSHRSQCSSTPHLACKRTHTYDV